MKIEKNIKEKIEQLLDAPFTSELKFRQKLRELLDEVS